MKLLEWEIVIVEWTQMVHTMIEGIYFILGYLPHHIIPRLQTDWHLVWLLVGILQYHTLVAAFNYDSFKVIFLR